MGTPNWGKLKAQGRVKDVGLPWNADEANAIAAGVPADYVRRGALTVEDFEKMAKADAGAAVKPLEAMNTAELLSEAKAMGVDGFTPDIPDDVLRKLVDEARGEVVEEKPKKTAKKTTKKVTKKTTKKA